MLENRLQQTQPVHTLQSMTNRQPTLQESTTGGSLGAMVRILLDQVFPWSCVGCGAAASSALCPSCRRAICWIDSGCCRQCGLPLSSVPAHYCGRCILDPPAFARLRAVAYYRAADEDRDPLAIAIRGLKYGRRRALASSLSEILAERSPFSAGEHDLVAPVPLHVTRLRERGFNQAALLAREPARRLHVPLDAGLLVRMRDTGAQVGLGEAERRRNVRRAFALRPGRRVAGLRLLIVDDVATSGATADACARALRAAGAVSVDVLAVARTLLH